MQHELKPRQPGPKMQKQSWFSSTSECAFSTLALTMKSNRARSRKPAVMTNSRWLAYATAGAASAFACANSAEASIHYSGIIGEYLGSSCEDKSARFQLDQPGDSFRLRHSLFFGCTASYGGFAHFG